MVIKNKEVAIEDFYLDGKYKASVERRRYVYKREDGTEYVSVMGNKVPVTRDENGVAHHKNEATTIEGISGQELLDMIAARGIGVVVILPDE